MYVIDKDLHLPLDKAREEIKKRWADVALRKAVEKELGDNFMTQFKDKPRGVSFRQVCSPDNGFVFFYQMAMCVGVKPLVLEYHKDIFVHFNEEKKGMGRIRVVLEDGKKATVDIMDFHANDKKLLKEVVLKAGERLVDFHRNLFIVSGCHIDIIENSKWLHHYGNAANYYPDFIFHFIAHGAWVENMEAFDDDAAGIAFLNDIVQPAIKRAEDTFGLKPLVVRLYPKPDDQDAEEDFYWWSYPPRVNDYIVKYAREHGLKFKPVKFLILCPIP